MKQTRVHIGIVPIINAQADVRGKHIVIQKLNALFDTDDSHNSIIAHSPLNAFLLKYHNIDANKDLLSSLKLIPDTEFLQHGKIYNFASDGVNETEQLLLTPYGGNINIKGIYYRYYFFTDNVNENLDLIGRQFRVAYENNPNPDYPLTVNSVLINGQEMFLLPYSVTYNVGLSKKYIDEVTDLPDQMYRMDFAIPFNNNTFDLYYSLDNGATWIHLTEEPGYPVDFVGGEFYNIMAQKAYYKIDPENSPHIVKIVEKSTGKVYYGHTETDLQTTPSLYTPAIEQKYLLVAYQTDIV